jgi:hypothetical protein
LFILDNFPHNAVGNMTDAAAEELRKKKLLQAKKMV